MSACEADFDDVEQLPERMRAAASVGIHNPRNLLNSGYQFAFTVSRRHFVCFYVYGEQRLSGKTLQRLRL